MENAVDKVSEAEFEILKVLWNRGSPMTAVQILDALSSELGWKRTTVNTLIKRLIEKAALHREQKDTFYYSPTITQDEFERARTEDFVNKVFGGNAKGLLSTLLNNDTLTTNDMTDLKNFWKARIEQDE
jgi:predicted transcriptional regulator